MLQTIILVTTSLYQISLCARKQTQKFRPREETSSQDLSNLLEDVAGSHRATLEHAVNPMESLANYLLAVSPHPRLQHGGRPQRLNRASNNVASQHLVMAESHPKRITAVLHNTFDQVSDLTEYLKMHGIRTTTWGTGQAKQVDDLFTEIQQKQSTLHLVGDRLLRSARVMTVVVRRPESPEHHLIYKEQRLDDGRIQDRNSLPSVKMFAGELVPNAATRAIAEELQSVVDFDLESIALAPTSLVTWNEFVESPSFPSLTTQYQLHQMDVVAPGLPSTSFTKTQGNAEHFWEWQQDNANDKRYKVESDMADDQSGCYGCRSPMMF